MNASWNQTERCTQQVLETENPSHLCLEHAATIFSSSSYNVKKTSKKNGNTSDTSPTFYQLFILIEPAQKVTRTESLRGWLCLQRHLPVSSYWGVENVGGLRLEWQTSKRLETVHFSPSVLHISIPPTCRGRHRVPENKGRVEEKHNLEACIRNCNAHHC